MQIHNLKLNYHFVDAVLSGEKCFEIRKNDRGFQKGDKVGFTAVDDLGITAPSPINRKMYEITYLLHGWGLQDGYCVFGIRPWKDERDGEEDDK